MRIPERFKSALERIVESNDVTFSSLVRLAGLDSKIDLRYSNFSNVDFRGSDLRDFDFSGSDLLGAIKDSTTLIDHTTVFSDSNIGWIEGDTPDIVGQMLRIQGAQSSASRQRLLIELVENYRSASHIRQFLITSLRQSKSIESFFDFVNAIHSVDAQSDQQIRDEFLRIISGKSIWTSRGPKRVAAAPSGFDLVLKKLEETSNPTMLAIADLVFAEGEKLGRTSLLDIVANQKNKLL